MRHHLEEPRSNLIAEIRKRFANRGFDVTSVVLMARNHPGFAAILEAAVPNCRNRLGRFRYAVLHRSLPNLLREHFTIDGMGWWR